MTEGTGGTGKTDWDRQKRKDRTGQAEQNRRNGTGRTGKTEWDRQNRKDGTDRQSRILGCTVLRTICFVTVLSVTNMFGDMYRFETVLLCVLYCLRTYRLMTYVLLCHTFVV